MPSKSAKQKKFMRAVAHSPKFAKKVGVPQRVGKEYEAADKRVASRAEGGQVMMNKMGMRGRMASVAPTGGPAMARYAKGGSIDGCAKKGKTKGKMVTMARGGSCGMKKGK
jgi:hypothetical protein